jgi:hypothetical protein
MSFLKKMRRTAVVTEQFKAMTPAQQRLVLTFLTAMKSAENLGKTEQLESQLHEWIRTDKVLEIAEVKARQEDYR